MDKVLKFLDGKKTNIAAGLVAIATIAKVFETITPEQFQAIVGVLAAFGLYSVRDSIRKLDK